MQFVQLHLKLLWLYGTGLRIIEALQLRVKDLYFAQRAIIVREGKGPRTAWLMLPQALLIDLRAQLARGRLVWGADAAAGQAGVDIPYALERKYPRAGVSWAWFWMFPRLHARDAHGRHGGVQPLDRLLSGLETAP